MLYDIPLTQQSANIGQNLTMVNAHRELQINPLAVREEQDLALSS
jgi:hypothetical protein